MDNVVLPFVEAQMVFHKVDVLPFEGKVQMVYSAVLSSEGPPQRWADEFLSYEEDVQMEGGNVVLKYEVKLQLLAHEAQLPEEVLPMKTDAFQSFEKAVVGAAAAVLPFEQEAQ